MTEAKAGSSTRVQIVRAVAAALLLAACASESVDSGASAAAGSNEGTASASAVTASIQPGSPEDFVHNVGDRVFFGFDRHDLTHEAQGELERQANWLETYPPYDIVIEGHSDERGTREYNLALGERRGVAARNYLVALGLDPLDIRTISYGKERPATPGDDEQAWAANRRAVTILE